MTLFQAQIVVLAAQILWSEDVEAALHTISNSTASGQAKMQPLELVLSQVESTLTILADSVLQEQPPLRRRKLEHLVRLISKVFRPLCGFFLPFRQLTKDRKIYQKTLSSCSNRKLTFSTFVSVILTKKSYF